MVPNHTRRVFGFCYRFTGKESEAQDLTRGGISAGVSSLKSYRSGEGAFATWAGAAELEPADHHHRRTAADRATESTIEGSATDDRGGAATSARPGKGCWRAGGQRSAGSSFCRSCRRSVGEAVILRDLQEMGVISEIAEVLKVPEGTVKEPSEPGSRGAGARAKAAESSFMTCSEIDIPLCDWPDGTLSPGTPAVSRRIWKAAPHAPSWPETPGWRCLSWSAPPKRSRRPN